MSSPESRSTSPPWAFIRPVREPWLPAVQAAIQDIAGESFTFRPTLNPGVSYADRVELSRLTLFDGVGTFDEAQAKANEVLDRIVHDEGLGLASIASVIDWQGLHYSASASKRKYGEIRIRFALQDDQKTLGRQKLSFKQALGLPVDGGQPAAQQAIVVGYLFTDPESQPPMIDFRRELNARREALPPITLGPVALLEK